MYGLLVQPNASLPGGAIAAEGALKGPLARVLGHVLLQVHFLVAAVGAERTGERLLLGVREHVTGIVAGDGRLVGAQAALLHRAGGNDAGAVVWWPWHRRPH